ncbi:Alkylated DNA repair protein alkB 8 [Clydaea vesicula]|uniref:Alkylated DNA repair protein alkB 8 n=1 Tax=Clydaea vesicula TaxID=447962 RepID=A0AAD5XUP5_9FUNG|nr:Alkylated DNA repair protein alkB 8 [Clydaea vesicula]KAJ3387776.1 Alkylated DNA repair protein alkB 8 [Lobulomyces angularis]
MSSASSGEISKNLDPNDLNHLAVEKEEEYVHKVYDAIAPHFSLTRYKPWPVVDDFLNHLSKGSFGTDVGCGNGKYISVNKDIFILGNDRSKNLIEICEKKGFEVLVGDACNLPYRDSIFDFALSIAVIHHFSTSDRRRNAIIELLRIVKKKGKILIFCWAFEQTKLSKRKFLEQDQFVTWKIPKENQQLSIEDSKLQNHSFVSKKLKEMDINNQTGEICYKRYYHLFKEGELESLCEGLDCKIFKNGYDKDNWWVILEKL